MSDTHEIEIPVSDEEKARFEAVLSVADAGDIIREEYAKVFGDIHPAALENEDIDADAIVYGDLDPESLPDEYKLENYDPDGQEVSDDV